ncbi:MAG: carbohydrate ABC transporter permease [Chloroflexota bacterium]
MGKVAETSAREAGGRKSPRGARLTRRGREALAGYLFIAPVMLYVAVIFGYPAVYTVVLSFSNWDFIDHFQGFAGLENYIAVWNDSLFWDSLLNTLYFTALSVPATVGLSLLIALGLRSTARMPFRDGMKTIYFLPVVTSLVAVAYIWQWLFNPSIGLINGVLRMLGLPTQFWLESPEQVIPSLVVMYVWARVGFNVIIFVAGLETIPRDYYDAARIDGVGHWQEFRFITLPLLNAQFVLVAVVEAITAFKLFALPYAATGGGPVSRSQTIVMQVYELAFRQFRLGEASVTALVLFAIILLVTVVQRKLLTRTVEY